MKQKRIAILCLGLALLCRAFWLGWKLHPATVSNKAVTAEAAVSTQPSADETAASTSTGPMNVYAHNLMLRKGPSFRAYVRWLRGRLVRASRNDVPSFDDPDSFFLDIYDGVLRANIGDVGNFLNSGGLGNSPLKNVRLWGDGSQVNIKGTFHKVVPLPVQITGELTAASDNRIRLHVQKIDVLKIPFNGC